MEQIESSRLNLLIIRLLSRNNKTLALLIQLLPSMQIFEGLESLRELVRELDSIATSRILLLILNNSNFYSGY